MQLSPFNAAAIKYRAGLTADPPLRGTVRRVVRWECPECSELHYSEDEAQDCCESNPAEPSPDPACPVCGAQCADHIAAADCCLWKDLDVAARMKTAAAVEAGSDWVTELNIK